MNYMRIRHVSADGSLRWETSGDGVTWTQRRSVSAPWAVSSMTAVVFGGTYQVVASPGPANGTTCSSERPIATENVRRVSGNGLPSRPCDSSRVPGGDVWHRSYVDRGFHQRYPSFRLGLLASGQPRRGSYPYRTITSS
jgi:hypothetical protein